MAKARFSQLHNKGTFELFTSKYGFGREAYGLIEWLHELADDPLTKMTKQRANLLTKYINMRTQHE